MRVGTQISATNSFWIRAAGMHFNVASIHPLARIGPDRRFKLIEANYYAHIHFLSISKAASDLIQMEFVAFFGHPTCRTGSDNETVGVNYRDDGAIPCPDATPCRQNALPYPP